MSRLDPPTLEIEVYIPNQLGFEKVVMASVATAARKAGFSTEKIEDIKTALAEACTNAIEYGNAFDSQTKVRVSYTINSAQLKIKVIDEGRQTIPSPLPDRTLRQDFRGMGLFLIEQLMDKLEIKSRPGRNEVQMVSYLPSAYPKTAFFK